MKPVRVVSLFSGCGAAELALQNASEQTGIPVEVVMAVDSWAVAARVRDANLPGVRTTVADVKTMTRADLPEHDLVIGGPPCQSHSTAGPKDCRCNVGGLASPRCCLIDFLRLADGSAWLMENVRSRLVNAPWAEQFCALDFGDVTTRRRWFYSDHLLHVHKTPGPRRFGHIRDHDADRAAIDRSADVARKKALEEQRQGRTYDFPPRGDGDALGSLGGSSSWRVQSGSTLVTIDGAVQDDDALGSLTQSSFHGSKNNGNGEPTKGSMVTVGMRSHSSNVVEYADDAALPSLSGTSYHGHSTNGVRCPSLLEMQRSHSLPDLWRWAGATKTQRGLLIANSWCVGLGTAVCAAMLRAVAATMERAA